MPRCTVMIAGKLGDTLHRYANATGHTKSEVVYIALEAFFTGKHIYQARDVDLKFPPLPGLDVASVAEVAPGTVPGRTPKDTP